MNGLEHLEFIKEMALSRQLFNEEIESAFNELKQDLLRIDELEAKAKAFDVLKEKSVPLICERNGKYLLVYPFSPIIELTKEQYEILKKAGVE